MRIIWIAYKDLCITARDRSGLLLMLAMPLVLIAVLGIAFGSAFASHPQIDRFSVGLVDQDGGLLAATLWDVLNDASLQELISPLLLTEAEARSAVHGGELAAAIFVPSGFSQGAMRNQSGALQVWRDPGQQLRPLIVEMIAQSFIDNLQAISIVASAVGNSGQPLTPTELAALGQQLATDVGQARINLEIDTIATGKQVDSFLYYAIGMASMFLLMSGTVGLSSLANEERRHTLARITASPTAKIQFLLGKSLGLWLITLVQFIILYLVTTFVFGTDWGNPLAVLSLAGTYAFAIAGLSTLVASLVPNRAVASNSWVIGVQIMAALGGSMVPLSEFTPLMLQVAHFSPSYWGLQGFLDIGMAMPLPLLNLVVLATVGFAGIIIGNWRLARG